MNNILYAIGAAAYKGHDEALSLLLSALITRKDLDGLLEATEYIILNASQGNQLSTLKLGLELGTRPEPHLITQALLSTTSLPIFERLLPLARDYFIREMPPHPVYFGILLKDTFEHQVSSGVIPIMDYILRLNDPGLSHDGNYAKWKRPMRRAAKAGSLEAVVYLWNHGFPVDKDALDAAVKHGNPDVVQFLLEQPDTADYPLKAALYAAIRQENDKVVRVLLTEGSARLNEGARENAQREAKYRGLESMESLIREYQLEE
ncbi:c-x8-c-x5-c-x3-h type zinc finger protein [Apiospora arundinis]